MLAADDGMLDIERQVPNKLNCPSDMGRTRKLMVGSLSGKCWGFLIRHICIQLIDRKVLVILLFWSILLISKAISNLAGSNSNSTDLALQHPNPLCYSKCEIF